MPQKLLNIIPKGKRPTWSIGDGAINRRPEQATIIGRCIARWPDVEAETAILLGVILGAETPASVGVYLALRQGRARYEALNAAAEVSLSERDFELFSAILRMHDTAQSFRDKLAHGFYGTSDDIPDGVLWVDSKVNATWTLLTWTKHNNKTAKGNEHDELTKEIYVYRSAELEQIHNYIAATRMAIFHFIDYLRLQKYPKKHRKSDEVYDLLCNEPHIRTILSDMRVEKEKRATRQ